MHTIKLQNKQQYKMKITNIDYTATPFMVKKHTKVCTPYTYRHWVRYHS